MLTVKTGYGVFRGMLQDGGINEGNESHRRESKEGEEQTKRLHRGNMHMIPCVRFSKSADEHMSNESKQNV